MTRLARARADNLKACCAAVYGSGLVELLLGGRLHPGGDVLTRRLADLAEVGPGDRVLDVASGRGSTARLLVAERGAVVRGIDLSPTLVAAAQRDASEAGLADLTAFEVGDGEQLDVRAASFDVVLCECALCTFPDQAAAVDGFHRALRPGGRVGIADVTLERTRLPADLDTPIGRIACVAGAQPAAGYERLLCEGGFAEVAVEPHPEAALATADSIGAGLEAAREVLRGVFDVEEALRLADVARSAILAGAISYALITARVADDVADRLTVGNSRYG